jgi:hypothetical protein
MSLQTQAPMSIKAMLRAEGVPLGGSVRADRARLLDDALLAMFEAACIKEDGEAAAVMLFGVCSCDPSFIVPHWLKCSFRRHRAAIVSAVNAGHFSR